MTKRADDLSELNQAFGIEERALFERAGKHIKSWIDMVGVWDGFVATLMEHEFMSAAEAREVQAKFAQFIAVDCRTAAEAARHYKSVIDGKRGRTFMVVDGDTRAARLFLAASDHALFAALDAKQSALDVVGAAERGELRKDEAEQLIVKLAMALQIGQHGIALIVGEVDDAVREAKGGKS